MGLFRSLAIALFILALPVALIATNVRFAASEHRVYDYSVRRYDAASVAGIPEEELLRANRQVIRYLTAANPGPLSIEVRDSQGQAQSLFNARETAHMADVRALFQAVFRAQVIAVAAVLSLAVLMVIWWPVRALAAAILYGSLLTMGVVGLAGALAMTGFDSVWSQFHFLAFSNDLWRLNPDTDHLIQMFPEAFWQDITTLLGAFTMLEAMVIGGLSLGYLILSRPASAARVTPEPRPRLPRPPAAQPPPRIPPPQPRHYIH